MEIFKVIVKNKQRPFRIGHNILAKNEDDARRIQREYKIGNPMGGNAKVIRVYKAENIRDKVWKEEDLKKVK